jgi:hypothetical protein
VPRQVHQRGEQPVAGRRDLKAVIALELRPHPLVVVGQQVPPGEVADLSKLGRRVDDVGEQQGDQRPARGAHDAESREGPQPRPLDLDAWLVAHGVAIVTWRNLEHVASHESMGPAVAHGDPKAAREHDAHVARLAPVRADLRSDVHGPPPPRLVLDPRNREISEIDLLDLDERHPDRLVRLVEALGVQLWHGASFSLQVLWASIAALAAPPTPRCTVARKLAREIWDHAVSSD